MNVQLFMFLNKHNREYIIIKFNKHNVTDTVTKKKARIIYSIDNRIDNRKCVTLYARDIINDLSKIFSEYQNNSDTREDYFENGKVVLFETHPLYKEALERANSL